LWLVAAGKELTGRDRRDRIETESRMKDESLAD
jgi:hypothetical protein